MKNKKIRNFVKLVNNVFGENALIIADHWEIDLCAIGLQKGNKLIYVANDDKNKDQYFYELELLQEVQAELDMPYIVCGRADNVSAEKLLEVMNKFFDIKKNNLSRKLIQA